MKNEENYLVDFVAEKILVIIGYFGLRISLIMYGNYRKGLKGFDEGNMESCIE